MYVYVRYGTRRWEIIGFRGLYGDISIASFPESQAPFFAPGKNKNKNNIYIYLGIFPCAQLTSNYAGDSPEKYTWPSRDIGGTPRITG